MKKMNLLKFSNKTISSDLKINKFLFNKLVSFRFNSNSSILIGNQISKLNQCLKFNKIQTKNIFSKKETKKAEDDLKQNNGESSGTEEKSNDQKVEDTKDQVSLKKYTELKALYDDSEENLEKARNKFNDLRKAYLTNQDDLARITKRADSDIAQAKEFAITKFAKDMLDVYDNFDRALKSIEVLNNEDKKKELGQEEKIKLYEDFIEGVVMTKESLNRILGFHGVKEYIPKNEKFDPNKHEAIYHVPSDKLTPGTVSDVIQSGFSIGNRVLRPAKVSVAKKH